MPGNIKQFDSPINEIHPSETGAETLARVGHVEKENIDQAGRIYGGLIEQGGKDVSDYEYSQEVSQGSAALAAMHNNMITAWNKTTAATDPNDTGIQKQFMDNAYEQLNKWQDSFDTKRGQEWATSQADQVYNHLWNKTSADMGIRAGEAAVSNTKVTLQNLADTAGKDFTTMDHALDQVDSMIKAQGESGALGQAQLSAISADMKNEIVKSGLKGLADQNPAAAASVLETGKFNNYMSADERSQLATYTQVQAHGRQMDQQRTAQAQQYAQQQKTAQVNAEYVSSLAQGKTPTATQIIADRNLTSQQKGMWIAKDGILALPESTLHSPLYGNNFGQAVGSVYAGKPLSDDAVLDAIRKGNLTPNGAAQLQKLSAMSKTTEGVAELNAQKPLLVDAQAQIVKGGPVAADPKGQQLYNRYMQTFYQAWDANIRKGITPAQMADPKDPNYIGNLAQQFKRSDAQAIADITKVR